MSVSPAQSRPLLLSAVGPRNKGLDKGTIAQLPPTMLTKITAPNGQKLGVFGITKRLKLIALSLGSMVLSIVFIPSQWIQFVCSPKECFKALLLKFKSSGQPLKLIWKQCFDNETAYTKFQTPNGKTIILGPSPKKCYFDDINAGFKNGTIAQLSIQQRKELTSPLERSNAVKQKVIGDIPDHSCLNLEQLENAADKLNILINTKGTNEVYVHCHAGMSRSSMAVLGYLVKYEKMDPVMAMAHLKAIHPQSKVGWPEGLEGAWNRSDISSGNVQETDTVQETIDELTAKINNPETTSEDKKKYKAQRKKLQRCKALFELEDKFVGRPSLDFTVTSTSDMAGKINNGESIETWAPTCRSQSI